MKKMTILFSILVTVSVAKANEMKQTAALDFEGRISSALGLEHLRDSQPCAITVQPHGDGSTTFFFSVGDKMDLHGTRMGKKTLLSDVVYKGPEEKVADGVVRYEVISLDYSSGHSKIKMTREVRAYRPQGVYSETLSTLKCKATLKEKDVDSLASEAAVSAVVDDELKLDI